MILLKVLFSARPLASAKFTVAPACRTRPALLRTSVPVPVGEVTIPEWPPASVTVPMFSVVGLLLAPKYWNVPPLLTDKLLVAPRIFGVPAERLFNLSVPPPRVAANGMLTTATGALRVSIPLLAVDDAMIEVVLKPVLSSVR